MNRCADRNMATETTKTAWDQPAVDLLAVEHGRWRTAVSIPAHKFAEMQHSRSTQQEERVGSAAAKRRKEGETRTASYRYLLYALNSEFRSPLLLPVLTCCWLDMSGKERGVRCCVHNIIIFVSYPEAAATTPTTTHSNRRGYTRELALVQPGTRLFP